MRSAHAAAEHPFRAFPAAALEAAVAAVPRSAFSKTDRAALSFGSPERFRCPAAPGRQ